jgi:hypothetical protein
MIAASLSHDKTYMTPLNYSYVFSNVLTFGTVVFFINAMYFRRTHKTMGGIQYKPGSPEQKWFEKVSSNIAIGLILAIFCVSIVNIALQVKRYLTDEASNSTGFLIGVPLVVALCYIGTLLYARSLGSASSEHSTSVHKRHVGDEEEW